MEIRQLGTFFKRRSSYSLSMGRRKKTIQLAAESTKGALSDAGKKENGVQYHAPSPYDHVE